VSMLERFVLRTTLHEGHGNPRFLNRARTNPEM
jgi:hypothetical protein